MSYKYVVDASHHTQNRETYQVIHETADKAAAQLNAFLDLGYNFITIRRIASDKRLTLPYQHIDSNTS
jgi:hypothetical protein